MKRKEPESCSAERPAPKVAYIDCPRRCWHRVEEAIQYAVEMGATIINMTVDREDYAWVGKNGVQNVSSVLKAAWGGQNETKNHKYLSLGAGEQIKSQSRVRTTIHARANGVFLFRYRHRFDDSFRLPVVRRHFLPK